MIVVSAEVTIRRADIGDIDAITSIYNEAVQTTTATFDIEPRTHEQQLRWLETHDATHPIWIAQLDGEIVGWASLSRWSPRAAYDGTVESSMYVRQAYRGRGIGRQLKELTVDQAKELGFHTLLAQVASESGASRHLNESLGFKVEGRIIKIGENFVLDG